MDELEHRSSEYAALDAKKNQLIKDLISYAKGLKKSLQEAVVITDEKDKSLVVRDARIADLIDKSDQAEARVHAQDEVIKDLRERLGREGPKTRMWLDTLKKIGDLVGAIDMTEDGAGALNCVEPQSINEPTVSIATQTDNGKMRETRNVTSAETQTDACQIGLDNSISIISSLPVEAQSALQAMHCSQNGTKIPDAPYLSVLIDGSSMLFEDKLVQKGYDGGREAARLLNAHIARDFGSLGSQLFMFGMIVHIVDNKNDACKQYTGIVHPDSWEEFVRGFNQTYARCYYVDAPDVPGKVAYMLRTQTNDPNCRHVYLGPGGDGSSYGELLRLYISDDSFQDKITLLQGPPFSWSVEAIGDKFRRLSIRVVFRHQELSSPTQTASKPLPTTFVLRNAKGERVDERLDHSVVDYDRVKHLSLCYTYHILGKCSDAMVCDHKHGELTYGKTEALRAAARRMPCGQGSACDNRLCLWGHHCGETGEHDLDECWFPKNLHDIDKKVVTRTLGFEGKENKRRIY